MRKLLILALGSIGALLAQEASATTIEFRAKAPEPIRIEPRRYCFTDSVKRYFTFKTPVLGASDLSKQALDTLNFKDVTLPARLRARHLVWQQTPRRWAINANRYFTGRVPVASTLQPIVTHS